MGFVGSTRPLLSTEAEWVAPEHIWCLRSPDYHCFLSIPKFAEAGPPVGEGRRVLNFCCTARIAHNKRLLAGACKENPKNQFCFQEKKRCVTQSGCLKEQQ